MYFRDRVSPKIKEVSVNILDSLSHLHASQQLHWEKYKRHRRKRYKQEFYQIPSRTVSNLHEVYFELQLLVFIFKRSFTTRFGQMHLTEWFLCLTYNFPHSDPGCLREILSLSCRSRERSSLTALIRPLPLWSESDKMNGQNRLTTCTYNLLMSCLKADGFVS